MPNPYRDSRGRFSSGGSGGTKGATSPAKRLAAGAANGRVVATIGRESMVMSKKDTPEETRAKVVAAGARSRLKQQVHNLRARTNAAIGSPTLMRRKGVISKADLYIPVGTGGESNYPRRG